MAHPKCSYGEHLCEKGSSLSDHGGQQFCSPWPYKSLLKTFTEKVLKFSA